MSVGFDQTRCEYALNSVGSGTFLGPVIEYATDFSQAPITAQCSAPSEFSVVTGSLEMTYLSSVRLVSVRLDNGIDFLPTELPIEVLRQAVNEGVGAPCP